MADQWIGSRTCVPVADPSTKMPWHARQRFRHKPWSERRDTLDFERRLSQRDRVPKLLPLQGEHRARRTADGLNEARVNVSTRGFWSVDKGSSLTLGCLLPWPTAIETWPSMHSTEKINKIKQSVLERIQNVDHSSFTPLVFTTSGRMGPRAVRF